MVKSQTVVLAAAGSAAAAAVCLLLLLQMPTGDSPLVDLTVAGRSPKHVPADVRTAALAPAPAKARAQEATRSAAGPAAAPAAPSEAEPPSGSVSVGLPSPSPRLLIFGEHDLESGDWCKGLRHIHHSLACRVFVAFAMNRSLVLDRFICLGADHVGHHTLRPVALYFDLDALAGLGVAYVYRDELRTNSSAVQPPPHNGTDAAKAGAGAAAANATTWKKLKANRDMVIEDYVNESADVLMVELHKNFNTFNLCYGPKNEELIRKAGRKWWDDWLPLNPHLLRIAHDILATLTPLNFTAVHVRRGDKVKKTYNWPHLDNDTQPPELMKKLPKFADPGSHLYIASTEPPEFFEPLRAEYKLHFVVDYSYLWGRGSRWHAFCKRVRGVKEVPVLDSYMQAEVDYTVMESALHTVKTFNDLTDDPECGVLIEEARKKLARLKTWTGFVHKPPYPQKADMASHTFQETQQHPK